jgi:hypothetical protein
MRVAAWAWILVNFLHLALGGLMLWGLLLLRPHPESRLVPTLVCISVAVFDATGVTGILIASRRCNENRGRIP